MAASTGAWQENIASIADQTVGNADGVVLITSAALTTNTNASDQTNSRYKGVVVFITPGAFGSGASAVVVTIEGKDPVSGNYYTILASASLSANTFTTLTVFPGAVAVNNSIANAVLPKTWRVKATASNWGTGGSTLGVSCSLSV